MKSLYCSRKNSRDGIPLGTNTKCSQSIFDQSSSRDPAAEIEALMGATGNGVKAVMLASLRGREFANSRVLMMDASVSPGKPIIKSPLTCMPLL